MDMVTITFVLLGILSPCLALYSVWQVSSSIFKYYKYRKKLDIKYTLAWVVALIVSIIISLGSTDFAYYQCVVLPEQRHLEKVEKELEKIKKEEEKIKKEKEEEARREYIRENGEYEYEEFEVVVVDKQTELETSIGSYRNTYYTHYVIILEDESGYRYEDNSRSLYYNVNIGDTVISKQTKVIDKNNGEILEIYEPEYYKKAN